MLTYSKLKEMEAKTIQVIRTLGVFGKLSTLQEAAKIAQVARGSTAPVNVHLSFTLPTRLREDGNNRIDRPFHVGCFAKSNNDRIVQLSYSVLIGKDASPSTTVARKFHFDFEPVTTRNTAESKPTFHLQMCGELSQHHMDYGYTEESIAHLLPEWSTPRIPSSPMSLALVLNWLFIEFGHEAAVRTARLDPTWRKLVREAERDMLKPYFDSCASFLGQTANNDESFFAKELYQES